MAIIKDIAMIRHKLDQLSSDQPDCRRTVSFVNVTADLDTLLCLFSLSHYGLIKSKVIRDKRYSDVKQKV